MCLCAHAHTVFAYMIFFVKITSVSVIFLKKDKMKEEGPGYLRIVFISCFYSMVFFLFK